MGTLKRIFGICEDPNCFNKGRRCFGETRTAVNGPHAAREERPYYCLPHASRHGYCVVCGVLATRPDPFRDDKHLVICRDCSLKREQWRRQGPAPG